MISDHVCTSSNQIPSPPPRPCWHLQPGQSEPLPTGSLTCPSWHLPFSLPALWLCPLRPASHTLNPTTQKTAGPPPAWLPARALAPSHDTVTYTSGSRQPPPQAVRTEPWAQCPPQAGGSCSRAAGGDGSWTASQDVKHQGPLPSTPGCWAKRKPKQITRGSWGQATSQVAPG